MVYMSLVVVVVVVVVVGGGGMKGARSKTFQQAMFTH